MTAQATAHAPNAAAPAQSTPTPVAQSPASPLPAQAPAATPVGPRNILEAIIAVRNKVKYVQKQKAKDEKAIKYTFAGIENMLAELRDTLDATGIVIYPSGNRVVSSDRIETNSGGKTNSLRIEVSYTVTHAASGTTLEPDPVGIGEANDSGDKATPKCFTLALKQVLRQLFLIETGDMDPEAYANRDDHQSLEDAGSYTKALYAITHADNDASAEKFLRAARERFHQGRYTQDQWETLETAYLGNLAKRKAKQPAKSEAASQTPIAAPNQSAPGQQRQPPQQPARNGGRAQTVNRTTPPARPSPASSRPNA